MDVESESSFVECEAIGNAEYIDVITNYKFFREIALNHVHVRLGDCVRVQIEQTHNSSYHKPSDDNLDDIDHAYGIVLALFEDSDQVN